MRSSFQSPRVRNMSSKMLNSPLRSSQTDLYMDEAAATDPYGIDHFSPVGRMQPTRVNFNNHNRDVSLRHVTIPDEITQLFSRSLHIT
ncbi:hypothetical protein EON65_43205 [archaeon]|nr:MAG: hypothetical protein EON65_43205 [archaeon]